MSNIFIVYDQNGNITNATTSYPNVTPPAQLLVCDDTTSNSQAALAQPQNYMVQNGQIIQAVTLAINRTISQSGSWYQYSISISASDNGSHAVNLNIAGHEQTITTPSTVEVNVHQSVNGNNYPITATGTGIVTQESFAGGNSIAPTSQTYTDSNGLLHIAPTQKATLLSYYTSQFGGLTAMADVATGIGMLISDVYGKIYPALTGGASPLVTLDANQGNAVTDIQNNIIPKIQTTLENAAPKPASGATQQYDLHYASFSRHWNNLEQAFQDYASDIQNIPNLV